MQRPLSRAARATRVTAVLGFLISLTLTLAPISPGHASVIEALELPDLVAYADQVLVGRATSATSRRDGQRIVTDTTVVVEERWKGEGAREVVVTTLGGAVDGIGMRVEGAAHLAVGEDAVLFARRGHRHRDLVPVGMSQGLLPVRRDGADGTRRVHPGGIGLSLMRRVGGGQLVNAPGALLTARPFDEVRAEVLALVTAGSSR